MEEKLSFYKENGYVVVPDALSGNEVETLNKVIDRDLEENEQFWIKKGDNGRLQNAHILLAHPEMDDTMRPPKLLPLMETILGPDLCADEHSVMIRKAYPEGPTECRWHRDLGECREPPFYTQYLSGVFYLTDTDDTTHTFSVLPGTSQKTEFQPLKEQDLSKAVHITGVAGTAILFNAFSFHAGNVRNTNSERRTIHIYCSRATDACTSNYTIFPRRLWEGKDEATRKYYSRPSAITKMLMDSF